MQAVSHRVGTGQRRMRVAVRACSPPPDAARRGAGSRLGVGSGDAAAAAPLE